MADQGNSKDTPRHASSSSSVSRDCPRPNSHNKALSRHDSKRSNAGSEESSSKHLCAAPPLDSSQQGPLPQLGGEQQPSGSQQPDGGPHCSTVNTSTSDHKLVILTNLLSGLVEKLDKRTATRVSPSHESGFSGLHDLSPSACVRGVLMTQTPWMVWRLSPTLSPMISLLLPVGDDADFLKALSELSDNFVGDEPKGDPISDCLATIVNSSLRRRPAADSVKSTAINIKVSSNVPNMKVPRTNPAIVKAMSVGGKLVDAWLTHTNGLLLKALVPITQCISDIGEKKGNTVNS